MPDNEIDLRQDGIEEFEDLRIIDIRDDHVEAEDLRSRTKVLLPAGVAERGLEPGMVYEIELYVEAGEALVEQRNGRRYHAPEELQVEAGAKGRFCFKDKGKGKKNNVITYLDEVDLGEFGPEELDLVRNEVGLIVSDGGAAKPVVSGVPFEQWKREVPDRAEAKKKEARARHQARAHQEMLKGYGQFRDEAFFNPYAFVRLPDTDPDRRPPTGHHKVVAGAMAGTITVRWKSLTPLMIRWPDPAKQPAHWVFPRVGDEPIVPGSTIKGSVRSLHETITGSCFRVFNSEFLPVYRETASMHHREDWTLARVVDIDDDGRPTELELTEQPIWIKAEHLTKALEGGPIPLGQRFSIAGDMDDRWRDAIGNPEVVEGGDSVVLITPSDARNKKYPYWAATAKLTGSIAKIADAAWADFRTNVEGARQSDGYANGHHDDSIMVTYKQNRHNAQTIGEAWQPGEKLHQDQVVWVKASNGKITALSLAALWRHKGEHESGKRVAGFQPCKKHQELCPSCRIFGSADTDGEDTDAAAQNSYRGHLRFSPARLVKGDAEGGEGFRSTRIDLATTGEPRPGAGQFYLANPPGNHKPKPPEKGGIVPLPLREWGSKLDGANKPRPIAGRKYSWHGELNGRHIGDPADQGEQANNVEAADAGLQWEATIHFENLTEAELGSLLAALQPSLILGDIETPGAYTDNPRGFATHLGGGKSLGLSSVQCVDLNLKAAPGADRYRRPSADVDGYSVEQALAAFKETLVTDSAQQRLEGVWKDLAAVLTVDYVDPERISYPPGRWWHSRRPGFDEHYAWFKEADGNHLKRTGSMLTLPRPSDLARHVSIPQAVEDRRVTQ